MTDKIGRNDKSMQSTSQVNVPNLLDATGLATLQCLDSPEKKLSPDKKPTWVPP